MIKKSNNVRFEFGDNPSPSSLENMTNQSQHQGSLVDQLRLLIPMANSMKLYDAADYLTRICYNLNDIPEPDDR